MGRREILVFIAAFAVVLLGGAALAQVGTFAGSAADDTATLSAASSGQTDQAPDDKIKDDDADVVEVKTNKTTTTRVVDTPKDEPKPEAPKGDQPESDEPKTEEPPNDDRDDTPPRLAILFPENEQHFDEERIAFEGKTEPGASVAAGRYEADVDREGNWRIVLILSPGGNLVTFSATDQAGNVTEESIKVFLDRDKETDAVFSAHQKWEVVDGSPATNVYYGTARPGSTIWVDSEFGAGSTKADDKGHWELRVKFPSAPCNESFKVVVEAEGNHRSEFRTKYVCARNEFTAHQKYGENTEPWTKFYGTGHPGSKVAIVSDFGSTDTTVGENGEWLAKLHFNDDLPANREIGIVVEGEGGRAEFGFIWIVKEVTEEEFTANQKYGSCGEEIPYDKFFGTAAAGSTIWVESPYGSGTTTAGEAGNWDIRVDFPEAPAGESFTVVIESSDGGRATFTFVRTGEIAH